MVLFCASYLFPEGQSGWFGKAEELWLGFEGSGWEHSEEIHCYGRGKKHLFTPRTGCALAGPALSEEPGAGGPGRTGG